MMARQRANGARSAKPARRRKSLSSAPKCDTPKLGQQGGNALADVRDWVTEDRKKVEHLQPFGDHWRNGPPALPLVATPVRGFVRGPRPPTLPLVATPRYPSPDRGEEALPYLRAATSHCSALVLPIPWTRASYHLGEVLAAKGDKEEAGAAFKVVLDRWGSARGLQAKE